MGTDVTKQGGFMSKENQTIIDKLTAMYGDNWWDESDYSERGL